MIDSLNKEHEQHKLLWRKLNLTSGYEVESHGVPPAHPGGQGQDNDRAGDLLEGGVWPALDQVLEGDGGSDGRDDPGPDLRHHHQVDRSVEHKERIKSDLIFAGRKYRLKNGATRDGRRQLGILNYTVSAGPNSGGGGDLDKKGEGSFGVGDQ